MAYDPNGPVWVHIPRRGGIPVGAIILITVGVVLLLQTTDVLPWSLWANLWRFWPLIIVAIGLNILVGGRASWLASLLVVGLFMGAVGGAYALTVREPSLVTKDFSEPLDGLTSADVRINFGAGVLTLGALPESSSNLVEGRFDTPGQAPETRLRRSGSKGELQIAVQNRRWFSGPLKANWSMALSRNPRLALRLDGGASTVQLDLRDLRATEVEVNTGASNVEITAPARAGHVDLVVNAGAANITVIVPEGVAARITRESGLSSFNVDTQRFPKLGDSYESSDFQTAENRISMRFRVGAASVSVP